jgi:1-acyl-sn-glycerol-3-phosphate acyltransferase
MKILYYTGKYLTKVLSALLFGIRIRGAENVPKSGGFILASNHISWYDPPLIGSWISRQVYFFAKAELFAIPLLGWAIRRTNALPVKRGTIDRKAIETASGVVKAGFGLTVFPEGTRSKIDGFLPPKPGLGLIASQVACPIVPCYVHGANRLKDCLWRRDRLSITYGEVLSVEWVRSFPDSKEGYLALSQAVMARIASIKESVLTGKVDRRPADHTDTGQKRT